MSTFVVGIDPGPTPGLVQLDIAGSTIISIEVLQCTHRLLWTLLQALDPDRAALLAVEKFVSRGRATSDQALTRDQVGHLDALYPAAAVRPAAQVKPWATDTRLEAAGLLEACKGMRHARDAGRHALFAAVHSGLLPDPLSKDWTR